MRELSTCDNIFRSSSPVNVSDNLTFLHLRNVRMEMSGTSYGAYVLLLYFEILFP